MKRASAMLFAVLSLFVTAGVDAQLARNGAYFELGGSGVIPTFNYERRVTDLWFGRVGASVVRGESEGDTDTTYVFPLTLSRVSRPASNHHLELGGGLTLAVGDAQDFYDIGEDGDESHSAVVLTGLAGYRYQRPGRGFQFRAVFTPVFGAGDLLPWGGLSIGYAW